MKLSKAQENVMNDLNRTLAVVDKYDTFEDFFSNSNREQSHFTTAFDCNGDYDSVEKYESRDPKRFERMRKSFYEAKNERILIAYAKTETIKKLESLGLIEIVKEAEYSRGAETVKVLAPTENKEESEEKTMTIRRMREEAKTLKIKNYSRMNKEELQKAINTAKSVEKVTKSLETEEVEVVLKAFTGMVIGTYTAVYGNGTYTLATKNGYLKFDESGKQIDAKNPKFANKIEKLTPDHFESGETIKARGVQSSL